MKITLIALLVATLSALVPAQQKHKSPSDENSAETAKNLPEDGKATQQEKKQLTDGEVKKLAKELAELREAEASSRISPKKMESIRNSFAKELEKLQKKYGEAEFALMEDSWGKVFFAATNESKKDRPAGEGRVRDADAYWGRRGSERGVEYAYRLPKGYSKKDSWPLIICLHDLGDDGKSYLKDVWDDAEGVDNYVLLAPSIQSKTIGRNRRIQDRIDRRDINDRPHLLSIFQALRDVLETYKIDSNRIFIEGTGMGATTALDLASAQPKRFAGVAARSGAPGKLKFLRNLAGLAPVLIVDREAGYYSKGDGAAYKTQMESLVKETGQIIEFRTYPPTEGNAARKQAFGESKQDRIPAASADIATYFAERSRNLAPKDLYYSTWNSRMFKRSAWVVMAKSDGDPAAGTEAIFHGKIKADNSIEVTTVNVERFSVYAGPSWLDLSKPIKIVVNGKVVHNEQLQPSLDYMLEYSNKNQLDPYDVVVGTIVVNVPAEEPDPKDGEGIGGNGGEVGGDDAVGGEGK